MRGRRRYTEDLRRFLGFSRDSLHPHQFHGNFHDQTEFQQDPQE